MSDHRFYDSIGRPIDPVATLYNPSTQLYEAQRTPSKFLVIGNTAVGGGTTAIWTPATGKKFRLLGFAISVSVALTTGSIVALRDDIDSTNIIFHEIAGNAANTMQYFNYPGNGYLSIATNARMGINASVACNVTLNWWGCEE